MKTLVLDFDGVINSYTSRWQGYDNIPDPPVEGSMQFLREAVEVFDVAIYSSRSGNPTGLVRMREWIMSHLISHFGYNDGMNVYKKLKFPTSKPPAHLQIDDRAITFTGTFPSLKEIRDFKPWYDR